MRWSFVLISTRRRRKHGTCLKKPSGMLACPIRRQRSGTSRSGKVGKRSPTRPVLDAQQHRERTNTSPVCANCSTQTDEWVFVWYRNYLTCRKPLSMRLYRKTWPCERFAQNLCPCCHLLPDPDRCWNDSPATLQSRPSPGGLLFVSSAEKGAQRTSSGHPGERPSYYDDLTEQHFGRGVPGSLCSMGITLAKMYWCERVLFWGILSCCTCPINKLCKKNQAHYFPDKPCIHRDVNTVLF